jgi:hypothetical protein
LRPIGSVPNPGIAAPTPTYAPAKVHDISVRGIIGHSRYVSRGGAFRGIRGGGVGPGCAISEPGLICAQVPSVIEPASKHDRPRRLRELEKAFADGAEASDSAVLTVSIIWLSALCAVFLLLCFLPWPLRGLAAILYLAAAAQVFSFGRQIGTFTLIGALLYPISLLCFFGLFGSSLLNRVFHRQATWRGRRV